MPKRWKRELRREQAQQRQEIQRKAEAEDAANRKAARWSKLVARLHTAAESTVFQSKNHLSVLAGDAFRIPTRVASSTCQLSYWFEVKDLDIELSATFQPESENTAHGSSKTQAITTVLEPRRISSSEGKVSGTIDPPGPGTFVFSLSNEYSFFTGKEITFSVSVDDSSYCQKLWDRAERELLAHAAHSSASAAGSGNEEALTQDIGVLRSKLEDTEDLLLSKDMNSLASSSRCRIFFLSSQVEALALAYDMDSSECLNPSASMGRFLERVLLLGVSLSSSRAAAAMLGQRARRQYLLHTQQPRRCAEKDQAMSEEAKSAVTMADSTSATSPSRVVELLMASFAQMTGSNTHASDVNPAHIAPAVEQLLTTADACFRTNMGASMSEDFQAFFLSLARRISCRPGVHTCVVAGLTLHFTRSLCAMHGCFAAETAAVEFVAWTVASLSLQLTDRDSDGRILRDKLASLLMLDSETSGIAECASTIATDPHSCIGGLVLSRIDCALDDVTQQSGEDGDPSAAVASLQRAMWLHAAQPVATWTWFSNKSIEALMRSAPTPVL